MQSGITASADLHEAFSDFASDHDLFSLPVTITTESLTPLPSIRFPSPSSTFHASLPSLDNLLSPTTPLYLLLRKEASKPDLVAVTYIPSRAPVRQKTLFASTRATLVRELGSEKFVETIFVTERDEILDPAQWEERSGPATSSAAAQGSGGAAGVDIGLLSLEERELQAVKRAEEEERHGTRGRDLMNEGGSGARYSSNANAGSEDGAPRRAGITMNITDEARSALAQLGSGSGSGSLVQLGIDIATETVTLLSSKTDVAPDAVPGLIPLDQPSYTFYTVAQSHQQQAGAAPGSIFIYVCPGASKIKERMICASSRRGVLYLAAGEGVKVLKTLEAGEPDDLVGRLDEEVEALTLAGRPGGAEGSGDESAPGTGTATPTPKTGFARPKRPGKR
ncbi:hypothetical protein A1O3_02629 [Capronia epimyces CBS 606.96]|uniref:ADF-H domain-containing protein n=1 Tax=Capronia epimyces CBS 606.96 TaxID=1182542 RepID=W9Y9N3_9EURO|nr:uncharacterized protein A1O3_02629 [Capronia epimyces CBS 606.96]EXJ89562.1 hypothetical protein A1O3_02629 [Capronia epimyces CBS 606.96]